LIPFWNILPRTGKPTAPSTTTSTPSSRSVILQDKGKVSALEAKLKAEGEFEVYRKRQDAEYISDFDREIKRLESGKT
jgi:hypothetical protein